VNDSALLLDHGLKTGASDFNGCAEPWIHRRVLP
jgi:hypothetical protein